MCVINKIVPWCCNALFHPFAHRNLFSMVFCLSVYMQKKKKNVQECNELVILPDRKSVV